MKQMRCESSPCIQALHTSNKVKYAENVKNVKNPNPGRPKELSIHKTSIRVTSSGSAESRAAHLVAAPLAVYMERHGVMQCRQCLQHKHTMVKSSATPWHEMI